MTIHDASALTFTARCPEDVLAVVPVVLGFEPAESLVMLTFGSDPPFHARIDLPSEDAEIDEATEVAEVVAALLEPARRHRVPRVFLVGYSVRDALAERTLRTALRRFGEAGVTVIGCLRTDGRRWHPVPRRPGVPGHGVPYDLSSHPFAARAVYEGQVVRGSRAELAATLDAEPDRVAAVVAALAGLVEERPPALREAHWARRLVAAHTAARTVSSDQELARLLRGMLDVRVRDAAWSVLERRTALAQVAFWSDVVRRSPDPLLAAPAALLAFAAWQAGEGALAWCAVDRCWDVAPDYSLAHLVAQILTGAIPPQAWDGVGDWERAFGSEPAAIHGRAAQWVSSGHGAHPGPRGGAAARRPRDP